MHPRHIDNAIDDDVGNVNTLGAELLRHALSDRTQTVFARCEGGKFGARLDRRGCAGEQNRAFPVGHHALGGLASNDKASV